MGGDSGHRDGPTSHSRDSDRRLPVPLLISTTRQWTGNVDFGDLAVGDRWADLAIASLTLDGNVVVGHQSELFAAYGIEADEERIRFYRALWQLES
jgi:kanamycin kinase